MKRGFTLIELLVVIAVIAVLAAILFPVFAKARERARQMPCLNNQRQLATSLHLYAQDHDQTFPAAAAWVGDLAGGYGVQGKVWDCPSTRRQGSQQQADYLFSILAAERSTAELDPAYAVLTVDGDHAATTTPLTYANVCYGRKDIQGVHNGGMIMSYADGHAAWSRKVTGVLSAVALYAASTGVETSDGTKVTKWRDMSGNGNDLVQFSAGTAPSLVPEGANGLASIHFTTALQTALKCDTLDLTKYTQYSAVAVVKHQRGNVFSYGGGGGGVNVALYHGISAPNNFKFGYQNQHSTNRVGPRYRILGIEQDDTAAKFTLYMDGKAEGTFTTATALSTITYKYLGLGCLRQWTGGNFSSWLDGDIAEVLFLDHVMDGNERAAVTGYLKTKYSIQ
jgi:prepilin-type N-terminal cleavage/methylation domain-containing protein/prepilin-type processing-associated H-X9-DG protein